MCLSFSSSKLYPVSSKPFLLAKVIIPSKDVVYITTPEFSMRLRYKASLAANSSFILFNFNADFFRSPSVLFKEAAIHQMIKEKVNIIPVAPNAEPNSAS